MCKERVCFCNFGKNKKLALELKNQMRPEWGNVSLSATSNPEAVEVERPKVLVLSAKGA